MPCLRHTSAVFAPASCSCRIAMICSSLNRLRFIVRPPSGGRTLLKSGGASGAQVNHDDLAFGRAAAGFKAGNHFFFADNPGAKERVCRLQDRVVDGKSAKLSQEFGRDRWL